MSIKLRKNKGDGEKKLLTMVVLWTMVPTIEKQKKKKKKEEGKKKGGGVGDMS
jgi:hypothetical protein